MIARACGLARAWAARHRLLRAALGIACLAAPRGLAAQPGSLTAGVPRNAALTVDLLTIGQGEWVFEKFGHNAIVITDPVAGTSIAYNWGVFDFNQPNFVWRFFTGDTKYWVAPYDSHAMVEFYKTISRTIEVQRLDLTPGQALALRNLIERNLEGDNKYYRYDYFRDNCSTRVRDLIDQVLGGALRRATDSVAGEGSFRTHVQRLVADNVWSYTGITIALGRRADSTLSKWEEMFIPMKVRDRVRELRVSGPDGTLIPLVSSERVTFASTRPPERTRVPDWTGVFFAIGALLAALVLALARSAPVNGRMRGLLIAFGFTWGALAGMVGVFLLLAATVTRHIYWQQNVSLALLPPTGLLFAPLWWRWLSRGRPGLGTTVAFGAFLLPPVLGTVLALLDGGWRGALPVIALTLPVHASLVASLTLVAARDATRALRFTAA